jgi:hypothetical protein
VSVLLIVYDWWISLYSSKLYISNSNLYRGYLVRSYYYTLGTIVIEKREPIKTDARRDNIVSGWSTIVPRKRSTNQRSTVNTPAYSPCYVIWSPNSPPPASRSGVEGFACSMLGDLMLHTEIASPPPYRYRRSGLHKVLHKHMDRIGPPKPAWVGNYRDLRSSPCFRKQRRRWSASRHERVARKETSEPAKLSAAHP